MIIDWVAIMLNQLLLHYHHSLHVIQPMIGPICLVKYLVLLWTNGTNEPMVRNHNYGTIIGSLSPLSAYHSTTEPRGCCWGRRRLWGSSWVGWLVETNHSDQWGNTHHWSNSHSSDYWLFTDYPVTIQWPKGPCFSALSTVVFDIGEAMPMSEEHHSVSCGNPSLAAAVGRWLWPTSVLFEAFQCPAPRKGWWFHPS